MGGSSTGGWSRLGDVRSLEQKAKAALNEGKRNVFISFATEDMAEVNLLRGQAKNDNNDIEFNDHSVREPYDSEQAEYIKRKIAELEVDLTAAKATARVPMVLPSGVTVSAAASMAPTITMAEMALVTAISGVCSAGVTFQTT